MGFELMAEELEEVIGMLHRIDVLASLIMRTVDDMEHTTDNSEYHMIYDWANEIRDLISGNGDSR